MYCEVLKQKLILDCCIFSFLATIGFLELFLYIISIATSVNSKLLAENMKEKTIVASWSVYNSTKSNSLILLTYLVLSSGVKCIV